MSSALAALAVATTPVAKAAVPAAHAPSSPGLAGAFFALLLVLGLILGLAWLLKRMPGAGLGIRPSEQLRVVSMLSVGAKERVMVIEVGKEQLLIGVTAGGITALHTLPEPLVVAPAPALPNFAELLAKRLRKES